MLGHVNPELAHGDPASPRHTEWLTALGRATYAATRLAGVAFDVLRVWGEYDSYDLYFDELGKLEKKLASMTGDLPQEMQSFRDALPSARVTRNDLMHALPTAHGLQRRLRDGQVRDFYTVESLLSAEAQMLEAAHAGNAMLYADGGESVRRWYVRS